MRGLSTTTPWCLRSDEDHRRQQLSERGGRKLHLGKTAYIEAKYDGGTTTTYVLDLSGVHIMENVEPTEEPTGNEMSQG